MGSKVTMGAPGQDAKAGTHLEAAAPAIATSAAATVAAAPASSTLHPAGDDDSAADAPVPEQLDAASVVTSSFAPNPALGRQQAVMIMANARHYHCRGGEGGGGGGASDASVAASHERAKQAPRQYDLADSARGSARDSTHALAATPSRAAGLVAATESEVGGLGRVLLERMGWQEGEGLGQHKAGRTQPVAASRAGVGGAGLGSEPALSEQLGLAPGQAMHNKRDALRLTRARYDRIDDRGP
jgi:hypothetical protein